MLAEERQSARRVQLPPNDNAGFHRRIDRWRHLIDAMKLIDVPFTLSIIEVKLAGWSFEEVCRQILIACDRPNLAEEMR